MVDLVAIVDVETTETENPQLIELAAVVYSVKDQTIVATCSELVQYSDPIADPINHISGIAQQSCEAYGQPSYEGKVNLDHWLNSHGLPFVETAIAHNVEHEKHFIQFNNWLCTYRDFDLFPKGYDGRRDLFSLALCNGVGISVGHRAIYDCLLIAEVFNRRPSLHIDFDYAEIPHVEAIAPVDCSSFLTAYKWDKYRRGWFGRSDADPSKGVYPVGDRPLCAADVSYENRDLAKTYGFWWNAEAKRWEKPCNLLALHEYPFPVSQILV